MLVQKQTAGQQTLLNFDPWVSVDPAHFNDGQPAGLGPVNYTFQTHVELDSEFGGGEEFGFLRAIFFILHDAPLSLATVSVFYLLF
jgi:hypothetical protein